MEELSTRLRQLIRTTILTEEAAGWATVRRIPSILTRKAVDYLAGLTPEERSLYYDAVETNALRCFTRPTPPVERSLDWPAYRRYRDAVLRTAYANTPVRILQMLKGAMNRKRPPPDLAYLPAEMLAQAAAMEPTSAPEIRKRIKPLLADRFGATAEKLGGGEWVYHCTWDGQAFDLSIDYGGQADQLRYHVGYSALDGAVAAHWLIYEVLVGAGQGNWDVVTATNLDDSLQLLCSLVVRLAEIPRRLQDGAT